jgi:hypothetical protein
MAPRSKKEKKETVVELEKQKEEEKKPILKTKETTKKSVKPKAVRLTKAEKELLEKSSNGLPLTDKEKIFKEHGWKKFMKLYDSIRTLKLTKMKNILKLQNIDSLGRRLRWHNSFVTFCCYCILANFTMKIQNSKGQARLLNQNDV